MLCKEKNRYFKRSHISEVKFRSIIRYFTYYLPASKIAELSGVSRPTINQLFQRVHHYTLSTTQKLPLPIHHSF